MKKHLRLILALVLFIVGAVTLVGQADSGSNFSFKIKTNLFTQPPVSAKTTARLAAWNPEQQTGLIAVRYVFPDGYHQIDDKEFFTLRPEVTPGVIFGSTLKGRPQYHNGIAEYFDETTLVIEFSVAPGTEISEIGIEALFQICDDGGTCLFPDSERHTISFNPGLEALNADSVVLSVLEWSRTENTAADHAAGASPTEEKDLIKPPQRTKYSLLLYLLMALVGGILLNVMPCVLPLLSVKALNLVKQAGQDRKAILRHSWLYVAGIEASFLALAAIVVLLQTSGKLLGWGFQFQSPVFVLILTAVIWVFGLSMFDVFVIEAPKKGIQGASAAGARGGYWGSFLTGIFAVLVATPCTAPFLGAALGFAFSQPPIIIFGIFSVTGLGLGLPFLLLGIWPKVIEKLPKPGNWMNTFKEVMGFLLLGTAVYLFTTFARLAPSALNGGLWWLLFLGFAAWLLGKARSPLAAGWFRHTGQIAALIIAVGSGLLIIDIPRTDGSLASTQKSKVSISETEDGAVPFVENNVLAKIDSGEPVFLEFTAAWCTTCKINQRVLNDTAVKDMLKEKGVVHVIGDLTAYDETLTRWLGDFGRAGVPLYVLYRPGEGPFVFPELITVEGLLNELSKL